MRSWRAWTFWLCLAAPWALAAYVWRDLPSGYAGYTPLLARGFSFYGIAAGFLLAAEAAAGPASRAGRWTMLWFHIAALVISFSLAWDQELCSITPPACASDRG